MNTKEKIRSTYGVNRQIAGEFDPKLAVKCANGTFVGKKYGDVLELRGVPFAKPPTGALRWQPPAPVEDSEGVFEAYYNGKTPIQTEWRTERASYYPQGEDCLYLNVWLNTADTRTDKTVMVFFHGGSYGWGGTADPLYDGKALVSKHPDIVLVTAAYRTGIMGFVDFSSVKGGEKFSDAPNLGLLDHIEALRWVQKNISAFGGNPDAVTIFGESAGGGTVSLLPIIPQAKGLFRRVIAQSGSVALTFSKKECRPFTEMLLKESKATCMDDLMKLDEDELKKLNEKVNSFNNFPQRDGKLIPFDPYLPYESGKTADIDLLIGTNADESNYWVEELGGIIPYRFGIPVKFENDMKLLSKDDKKRVDMFMSRLKGHKIWRMSEFFNEVMFRLPAIKQAQEHAENGGKAYMYYWTEESVINYRKACHAVELAYVFGNLDETIYTGKRADETLSNTVMQMWTNFARTGDPSVTDCRWLPYTTDSRATMVLGKKPQLKMDVLKVQRKLLFPLLKYKINASYATMDYNVPFIRRLAIGGIAAVAAAVVGTVIIIANSQ